ncbi:hypothetical protein Ahy_A02g009080 [Arachis hypogaea]|uniref:Uncharacterized protein n=1 Tax=Arachis hypogaea TaxID=3818 RepID=A0A445EG15_ARAHY|nr:hypothetical protein Ahy_A02g009080 [Arachis hypogaea]
MVRDCCMFDKIFWVFPSCVEVFKHCKPFVSVDGTHLYGNGGARREVQNTANCTVIVLVLQGRPSIEGVVHSDPATRLKPLVPSIVPLLQLKRPPYILTSTSGS